MKHMAPGLFLIYLYFRSTFPLHLFLDLLNQKYKNTSLHFICFYFILRFTNLLYLSLLDLILASDHEGIDNPFALGASVGLFMQVHRLETCLYLLLD